jgi:hypothetical protein
MKVLEEAIQKYNFNLDSSSSNSSSYGHALFSSVFSSNETSISSSGE